MTMDSDKQKRGIPDELYSLIAAYIDENYDGNLLYTMRRPRFAPDDDYYVQETSLGGRPGVLESPTLPLQDRLKMIDESFQEMLLRKIDEKGISDADCYKRAHVDRKLFSKIRADKDYRPSKETAIAFALALELPLDEMKEMLTKAGFALSHSSKADLIVEYFVENGVYDLMQINEALYAFDQRLIRA